MEHSQDSRCDVWRLCLQVLFLIALCVGLTHGVAVGVGNLPFGAQVTALVLIYGEAAAALVCLVGILYANPGVIERSEENCYPLPDVSVRSSRLSHRLNGAKVHGVIQHFLHAQSHDCTLRSYAA